MDEHQPGQGGSANTPPFPRRPAGSDTPASPPPADPTEVAAGDPGSTSAEPDADPPQASDTPSFSPSAEPTKDGAPMSSASPSDDDEEDWLEGDDDLDLEEDAMAADDDLDADTIGRDEAPASFAGRAGARFLSRAESAVDRGTSRLADRLEETAERLALLAEDRLHDSGPRARAGEAAQSAARWIDDLALYLRDRDAQGLREDLEHQVRERPVPTLLLAVAAGWIVGRIMR